MSPTLTLFRKETRTALLRPATWGVFAALKPVDEFDGNMLGIPYGWPWEWAWSNFKFVFSKFNVPITIMEGPFAGSVCAANLGHYPRVPVEEWREK